MDHIFYLVWGTIALALAVVIMAGLVWIFASLLINLGVTGLAVIAAVLVFLAMGYMTGRAALRT